MSPRNGDPKHQFSFYMRRETADALEFLRTKSNAPSISSFVNQIIENYVSDAGQKSLPTLPAINRRLDAIARLQTIQISLVTTLLLELIEKEEGTQDLLVGLLAILAPKAEEQLDSARNALVDEIEVTLQDRDAFLKRVQARLERTAERHTAIRTLLGDLFKSVGEE